MKKFQFSLQKLLNYREQLLNIEMGTLNNMYARLRALQDELEAIENGLVAANEGFKRRTAEGILAMQMVSHNAYIESLHDDILTKNNQISLQQQAIDRQMDKVREAKIEISTMEKLKERKIEEYQYLEMKEQELFIEEFVSNKSASLAGSG